MTDLPVPADDLALLRYFLYETLSKMTLRYDAGTDAYAFDPNEPIRMTADAHSVLMRLLEPSEPAPL